MTVAARPDDSAPRQWRKLTKREAHAVCESIAADQPTDAAAATGELEQLHARPADFSMESLDRLWPAMTAAYERLPVDGDVATMADLPVWAKLADAALR